MGLISDAVAAIISIVVIIIVAAIVIPIIILYLVPKKGTSDTSIFDYSTIELSGFPGEYVPFYYDSLGITTTFWNSAFKGENIKILVIDSGVNINHPDLLNVQLANTNVIDDLHGTAVAGVFGGELNNVGMLGNAYNAIVYTWDYGNGDINSVISAMSWAISSGIDVINCSFGTTSNVIALHSAIQSARTAGIYVIAAAGNDGTSTLQYPAAYAEVISVASLQPDGSLSTFSNYDPLNANIVSMFGEDIVTDNAAFTSNADLLVAGTGTSFSCPFVVGLCALVLQKTLHDGNPRPSLSSMVTLLKQHLPPNPA